MMRLDQLRSHVVRRLPPRLRAAKRATSAWRWGEPELRLLPALCQRHRLSIDIGANDGTYTWHLARFSAGVVAFEPQPDYADGLVAAFRDRVRVERVALSDTEGEAVLRVPLDAPLLGCATIEAENTLAELVVRDLVVAKRRLDSYALDSVGLIKIDVEGHELAVLRGAARLLARDKPNLIIEAEERHRAGAVDSILAYLRPLGYRGYYLAEDALRPVEDEGDATAIAQRCAQLGIYNFIFKAT